MRRANSRNCEMCNIVDGVQHLLMEPVKNQSIRNLVMEQLNPNYLDVGTIQSVSTIPTSKKL